MTPVLFHFVTPTGLPIANTTIEIQLSHSTFDVEDSGVLMPSLVTAITDVDGKATVDLWPNTSLYYVTVMDPNSDAGLSYKFLVPEVAPGLQVRLQDIVIVGEMSTTTYDAAALLVIQETKAITLSYQVAAAASAVSAAVAAASAADVPAYAASALASKNAAEAAAIDAAIDAQIAAAAGTTASIAATTATTKAAEATGSAVAANGSATAASGSAATATTKAGEATTAATAAGGSATTAAADATTATTQAGIATDKAVLTSADRAQTGLDRTATTADSTQTALDKIATAADRVQTGLDRTNVTTKAAQTVLDAAATAADRVQTGLDSTATAADRIQTGSDVTTSTANAATAITKAGEAAGSATDAAASAVLAAGYAGGGVTSFNGRNAAVVLTTGDVTGVLAKADIGLGNVDNTADANKPVSTAQAVADTAATNAAKAYADGLVLRLWDDCGSFNASVNTYPTTGGSGTAGVIMKGDIWTISVIASAGPLLGYAVGTTVRAAVDAPAQVAGNWAIAAVGLGYVPENSANKDASGGYPSLIGQALKIWNAAKTFYTSLSSTSTANRAIALPDKDGTVALTDDITGGTRAGSFTTLAASGDVSIKAPPGLTKNATRRYITIAGDGDVGALQLANSLPGTSNNGNIEWHDVGNTASASTRSAYITSGSNGTTPNNKGSIIVFATKPDGAGSGGVPCLTIDANGSTFVILPALLGYGPGAGGTVTQATSKATAVTLNKPCGLVTMHNAALAAGAQVAYTLTNSFISAADTVLATIVNSSCTGSAYQLWVTAGAGFMNVYLKNISAGSLSEPIAFNFTAHKGATS